MTELKSFRKLAQIALLQEMMDRVEAGEFTELAFIGTTQDAGAAALWTGDLEAVRLGVLAFLVESEDLMSASCGTVH